MDYNWKTMRTYSKKQMFHVQNVTKHWNTQNTTSTKGEYTNAQD